MSAKHPIGRTSTNQRQTTKNTCNLKMNVLDVRKTPLGRTSTNQRHEQQQPKHKQHFTCPPKGLQADIYKPASNTNGAFRFQLLRFGANSGGLGANLSGLGANWAPTWAVLGPSWAVLAPTWAVLEPTWAVLAPTWAVLGSPGGLEAGIGTPLGVFCCFFERSWGQLCPDLGCFGAKLSGLGALLGALGANLGALGA